MSVWGELGKAVNSTIQTGNIVPLDEMIESVKTPGAVRLVKSVQRSTTNSMSGRHIDDYEITISSVNPQKSIVLIDNGKISNENDDVDGSIVVSLTNTLLTISPNSYVYRDGAESHSEDRASSIGWQVIEFY